jgi:hypothetical protein
MPLKDDGDDVAPLWSDFVDDAICSLQYRAARSYSDARVGMYFFAVIAKFARPGVLCFMQRLASKIKLGVCRNSNRRKTEFSDPVSYPAWEGSYSTRGGAPPAA